MRPQDAWLLKCPSWALYPFILWAIAVWILSRGEVIL